MLKRHESRISAFVIRKFANIRYSNHKKWVSLLYRTATTSYPCCIPALGRFEGAGRTGLTRRESNQTCMIPKKIKSIRKKNAGYNVRITVKKIFLETFSMF